MRVDFLFAQLDGAQPPMAFFRNNAVNLLNLHYGMHTVALSGGGAFFAVYLLDAGLPVAGVLAALAAILAGRFLIRPAVIGLAARWGLKRLVIAGTFISAVQFPFLAEVDGAGWALYTLIAIGAAGDTVYWSTYHAYFAALGDSEHRGHQLGAREAIGALVGVASPLLMGWMLTALGPRIAFGATAVIAAAAALPLLWAPDLAIARRVAGAFKSAGLGVALFISDGWIAAGYLFVWQIALFLSLHESYLAYGGALALAALVGAAAGLLLGRHIDSGKGRHAVFYAFGTFACIIALRAAAIGNAPLAVVANAAGALCACLYIPTLMTAVYNEAKRSPCVLRFHVATEGGWDIGGAAGLLTAALMLALGAPLWAGVLLSLAGVVTMALLLRRYYAASGQPSAVAEARLEARGPV